ncbi:hypothetical protein [Veronia pacifica]|uniref:Uncharacterized protein n=1 Tax=Veronia pacifica TaxID=1080227 RepID=A0A1C3ELC9_9GAMM|nr:hypothetical protein [Veronia pacifica]ODA34039.1 hypothetical protein A8L45_08320 [Veronia pacifica]
MTLFTNESMSIESDTGKNTTRSLFWNKPWLRVHGSWQDIISLYEGQGSWINEKNQQLIMHEFGILPRQELSADDDSITNILIALSEKEETELYILLCGLMTNGCVSTMLTSQQVMWCSQIHNAIGLSSDRIHNEYIDSLFRPEYTQFNEIHHVLSAFVIMNRYGEESGFWSRYRLRFNRDLCLPEVNSKGYVDKLTYALLAVLCLLEDSKQN